MSEPDRNQGWDRKAVNRIAKEQYGSLQAMFDAHGWSTDGRVISHVAPTKVVQWYGSIAAFEIAHELGRELNYVLNPQAALLSPEPKVLLTSYYGFDPADWPCLTFTDEGRLQTVLAETRPGFFALIYGSNSQKVKPDLRGRIIGLLQLTHETGATEKFLSPAGQARKASIEKSATAWAYAFRALRSWSVAPETRPLVSEFAHETYAPERGISIGRYGSWLRPAEVRKIAGLDLIPESIFSTDEAIEARLDTGLSAIRPSRPGPVSQNPFMVSEAEGPKHLYVLKLAGNVDHFLGKPSADRSIFKVGFSKSPASRCHAFNKVMPMGAFRWHIARSTFGEGWNPFPSSRQAKVGEQEMIRLLWSLGDSLGGEFFLADESAIEIAWQAGIAIASKPKA